MNTEKVSLVTPTKDELWEKKDWLIEKAKENKACKGKLQQAIDSTTPEELERVFVDNIPWLLHSIINYDFPVILSDGRAWYDVQTAGNYGTATVGEYGKATVGEYGKATAGDKGTAIAGYAGTAIAGYAGKAIAGYAGTAIAGYAGKAIAGDKGTAIAGYCGTATVGKYGTATAGESGRILIEYWCYEPERLRIKVGYIGEDGLKPNIPYKLNDENEFVEATKTDQ